MSINVLVKSDPAEHAKGRFVCEIKEKGLVLKQGKKQKIAIPRGTPARYQSKNKFSVQLETYKLEITVAKFGSYQGRLAEDLAGFVNGDQPAPDPSAYGIEWYFYALSAVPFGIPIVTLGGAIPGAIGGGLFGACVGVAQLEQWPKPARLATMIAINVVAYVLLFALLATVLKR